MAAEYAQGDARKDRPIYASPEVAVQKHSSEGLHTAQDRDAFDGEQDTEVEHVDSRCAEEAARVEARRSLLGAHDAAQA